MADYWLFRLYYIIDIDYDSARPLFHCHYFHISLIFSFSSFDYWLFSPLPLRFSFHISHISLIAFHYGCHFHYWLSLITSFRHYSFIDIAIIADSATLAFADCHYARLIAHCADIPSICHRRHYCHAAIIATLLIRH